MFLNSSLPVPEILVSKEVCFRNGGVTGVNSFVIIFQDMGFGTFCMWRPNLFAAPQTCPRTFLSMSLYMSVIPDVLEWFLETLDRTFIIIVVARHRTRSSLNLCINHTARSVRCMLCGRAAETYLDLSTRRSHPSPSRHDRRCLKSRY